MVKQIEYKRFLESYSDLKSIDLLITDLNGVLRGKRIQPNILEKVCITTVENGYMTKDLAILIGPSTKYLNTNQFLDEVDGSLKKKLN